MVESGWLRDFFKPFNIVVPDLKFLKIKHAWFPGVFSQPSTLNLELTLTAAPFPNI
jgi:hypothetical protein